MGLRSGASSVKGFWLRLNGSPSEPGEPASAVLTALPLPTKSDREQRASSIAVLSQSIDALEKRLQDTSKVGCLLLLLLLRLLLVMLQRLNGVACVGQSRELKLRKAGISARARIASELRQMDEQVLLPLVRAPAVCVAGAALPPLRVCCIPVLALLPSAMLVVVSRPYTRQTPDEYGALEAAPTYHTANVQVTEVSRALAVHTMQLQMEYVAASLEDEALDLAERSPSAQLLLNRYRHMHVRE